MPLTRAVLIYSMALCVFVIPFLKSQGYQPANFTAMEEEFMS